MAVPELNIFLFYFIIFLLSFWLSKFCCNPKILPLARCPHFLFDSQEEALRVQLCESMCKIVTKQKTFVIFVTLFIKFVIWEQTLLNFWWIKSFLSHHEFWCFYFTLNTAPEFLEWWFRDESWDTQIFILMEEDKKRLEGSPHNCVACYFDRAPGMLLFNFQIRVTIVDENGT